MNVDVIRSLKVVFLPMPRKKSRLVSRSESWMNSSILSKLNIQSFNHSIIQSFISSCELEGHQVPDLAETVTTPMAELIVDQEYNAEEALKPLTSIQSALSSLPKTVTTFATDETVAIKSATEAIIEPFVDVLTPVATDEVAANEEEEDDAEEEINVEGQDAIHVDVPGKTVAVDDNTTPVPAGDEEVEELNVIQLDGTVTETLKIE